MFGSSAPMILDFPVALKTGTTRAYTDDLAFGTTAEYTVGAWGNTEPIAGPFEAAGGPRVGIKFTYFDTLGVALAAPTGQNVGRVDLTFRARSLIRGGTRDTIVLRDSVAVRVALRNRL